MTEELGNYDSSYFIMNVPVEVDLDIRNMTDEDFAVFFHEYIHFLQDITSFYGYSAIYSHGEYMRKAINSIYKEEKLFSVPLTFPDANDIVLLNKQITEFSLGDKNELDFVFIKDVSVERFHLTNNFTIPELHVKAATNQGQEEIIVGALAIRENMAYLLERHCTTKYKTSCDYPYRIVELLANKMCPGKLGELELIAICDIALQSSVPGHALFTMLDAVAQGRMVFTKPEDVYDFFFSQYIDFLGKKMETAMALMKACEMAIDHLSSYVRVKELSQEYQEWVTFTLQVGFGMRVLRPYFFLEMARDKKNKENAVLQFIAKNIGSPQMVNKKGKRYQLATERPICRFEYLEAVKEIEQLFEFGIKKCSLKPWCEMSPDGAPVDERCNNAPWKRCNDIRLCPYGLLWRHWNLAKYEVLAYERRY